MKKTMFCITMVLLLGVTSVFAEKRSVTLYIPDMECGNCQAKVEKTLSYERGVKKIDFDLAKREVTVEYDDTKTNVGKLQAALVKYLKYESHNMSSQKECSKEATCPDHKAQTDDTKSTVSQMKERSCCRN